MSSSKIKYVFFDSPALQNGYGVPNHIAPLGSIYVDYNTGVVYTNKDGLALWLPLLDSTYVFTGGTGTFTGGTVSGPTIFTAGLTSNNISATTITAINYVGLPKDIFVTGGTYSNGITVFTNNSGGTFNIDGFTTPFTGGSVNNLIASTISATTYQNLPIKYYAEFSATPSTSPIVYSANSIAIGDGAQARDIRMFVVGNLAGQSATGASYSNFIGYQTGYGANTANNSNFFGASAGYNAIGASNSFFIGNSAGYQATGSSNSSFIGYFAGLNASNSTNSNFLGNYSGQLATGVTYSNFLGDYAGFQASNTANANIIGQQAGAYATAANNSNFLGQRAGFQATGSSLSNFIGYYAGNGAYDSNNSIFMGVQTGYQAYGSTYSVFIGRDAGQYASNTTNSVLLGHYTGVQASGITYSNLLGYAAGQFAYNVTGSNFIGSAAGWLATGVTNSNFIGGSSGYKSNSNYSNYIGYQTGSGATGNNNIIIGTNISLPAATTNSINIGGVLFGTGTYGTTTGSPSLVAQSSGKVGINVLSPSEALHVSGNTLISGNLTAPTISATTYLGLPKDIFVTGGTYSAGTTTFTNNTGGTFSVTGSSITSSDINNVLGYTPYRYVNTTQTTVSSTISETVVATATISGNTFNSNDVMKYLFKNTKNVTTSNVTMRIKINTSNTLSGATQIATYTFATTSTIALMQRTFDLSGGNLYGFGFTSSQITDVLGISTGGNSTTYNTANPLYVFFTLQLGNSGDTCTFNMANITN